jgi:hypothetical protein
VSPMARRGSTSLRLTLVGPDGQAVSYWDHAVPGPEGLRAFLEHGWRLVDPRPDHAAAGTEITTDDAA